MDADLKQRWVAALRSGEYTQGTNSLVANAPGTGQPTHCCLGVLCELLEPGGDWSSYRSGKHNSGEDLSANACDRLGIPYGFALKLVNMNDGLDAYSGNPRPFAQIADHIEQEL